jgi:hypothetical protein
MSCTQTFIDFDRPSAAPVLPPRPIPPRVRWLQYCAVNPGVPRALLSMARERAQADGYVSM